MVIRTDKPYTVNSGWRTWSSPYASTIEDGGDGEVFDIILREPQINLVLPSPSIDDFDVELVNDYLQHETFDVIRNEETTMKASWGHANILLGEWSKTIMYVSFEVESELWRWPDGTIVQTWA